MSLSDVFYSQRLVEKLLVNGFISKNNITYQLVSKRYYKGDEFKESVELCYTHFEPLLAKKLVNRFIGFTGTKYSKSTTGFVTSSFKSVIAAWPPGRNCSVDQVILKNDERVYSYKEFDS